MVTDAGGGFAWGQITHKGGDSVSDELRNELVRLGFAPDEIDELTESEALYIYEEAVKKGFWLITYRSYML